MPEQTYGVAVPAAVLHGLRALQELPDLDPADLTAVVERLKQLGFQETVSWIIRFPADYLRGARIGFVPLEGLAPDR